MRRLHVALGKQVNLNGRHEFIQFVKTNHNHKPLSMKEKWNKKKNRTESIVMYANEIINNCSTDAHLM